MIVVMMLTKIVATALSEFAGQRAAVVMSLPQSARLNGHDLQAYLRDVFRRLPIQLNSCID